MMHTNNRLLFNGVVAVTACVLFSPSLWAAGEAQNGATFYVNVAAGDDANPGTKEKPFKTLPEAAKTVTEGKGINATTIVLAEGVYALDKTALFKPTRTYTKTDRLTIRAEVLPDDSEWNPSRMPVIIPTMPLSKTWMGKPDPFGGVSYGFQIETNHVTISGLKILGAPVVEHPDAKSIRRNYAIAREGRNLDDLVVTQCMFLGDPHAIPSHCSILANGHGLMLDHCVFQNCKQSVVFWNADGGPSKGCGMRYCLVTGAYGCGIWTVAPGEDFEFHHNVIADGLYGWIRQGNGTVKYKVTDSLFAGNKFVSGSGAGPAGNFRTIQPDFLTLPEGTVTDKKVQIEIDQTKRRYLHLVPGSPGADLGAGLFAKSGK